MNFIFKSKQKTPPELVRNFRDAVARFDANGVSSEGKRKVRQDLEKCNSANL